MTVTASMYPDILAGIPDPETIRRRLAVVLTETALLRAQLKVSTRLQRERDRLRYQDLIDGPNGDLGDE